MKTLLNLPETKTNAAFDVTEQPVPEFPGSAFERKRVLIVDDDALVRASLASVLEYEGYEVYGAADGFAAVKTAVEHAPDLVLLDLNMPNMDGWTAFAKLEDARPLIPVIVITARPHQYKHAVRLGVDAFMEKPLNIPLLLRSIRKLTFEPEERHLRRIVDPSFVTRLLGGAGSEGPLDMNQGDPDRDLSGN